MRITVKRTTKARKTQLSLKLIVLFLYIFEGLFSPQMIFAQSYAFDNYYSEQFRVSQPEGTSLHALPRDSSEILVHISKESIISCSSDNVSMNDTVTADWTKVQFQRKIGFVRSESIKVLPKIEVLCPMDWMDERNLPAFKEDQIYFGLEPGLNNSQHSYVSRYLGKDTSYYHAAIGSLVRSLVPLPNDNTKFIISGLNLKSGQQIQGRHLNYKNIYPGECLNFNGSLIYATGKPELSKNSYLTFSQIKNYSLVVRQAEPDAKTFKECILFQSDLQAWDHDTYEGGIRLIWMGDLDSDGKLDILLGHSTHYSYYDVILLLSSRAAEGEMFGQAARYRVSGC